MAKLDSVNKYPELLMKADKFHVGNLLYILSGKLLLASPGYIQSGVE